MRVRPSPRSSRATIASLRVRTREVPVYSSATRGQRGWSPGLCCVESEESNEIFMATRRDGGGRAGGGGVFGGSRRQGGERAVVGGVQAGGDPRVQRRDVLHRRRRPAGHARRI